MVPGWIRNTIEAAGFMAAFLTGSCTLLWWGARQHHLLTRKGYRKDVSLGIVFGGLLSGGLLPVPMTMLIDIPDVSPDIVEGLLEITIIYASSLVVATVVVAVLPRRIPQRTGARPLPFLLSATARRLERVLLYAGGTTVIFAVTMLWSSTSFAIHLLQLGGSLLALLAWFTYYRKRASAPVLDEAVATDPRAPVLYLRAFYQESTPFTWCPKKEMAGYTHSPMTEQAWGRTFPVTFDQYLGGRFVQELGPFIALGNPEDVLPPEGATRGYAADSDWQRHFLSFARAAVAFVMEPSYSSNLSWEIAAIQGYSWQGKLFIIIPPAFQANLNIKGQRWVYAAIRTAKHVPAPSWGKFAAELRHIGFHIDLATPDPGSVISFDPEMRAVVLIRGATKPESSSQLCNSIYRHPAERKAKAQTSGSG